jgi:hypothetical protein
MQIHKTNKSSASVLTVAMNSLARLSAKSASSGLRGLGNEVILICFAQQGRPIR